MLSIAVGASACSRKESSPQLQSSMPDSVFVDVMYNLLSMKNPPTGDTMYYAYQRKQTMDRYNVTLQDLEDKAMVIAADADVATEIWGKIRARLNPAGG